MKRIISFLEEHQRNMKKLLVAGKIFKAPEEDVEHHKRIMERLEGSISRAKQLAEPCNCDNLAYNKIREYKYCPDCGRKVKI